MKDVKKLLGTLIALASLTIASMASIFDNEDDAKNYIVSYHQSLGQPVTVNTTSVFVKRFIAGRTYYLAKAFITNSAGTQYLKCYVDDPALNWMNSTDEASYNRFLATGDRSGWALPSDLNPVPTTTFRPSNAQVSLAMNRLQDALGKPHVTSGVWYDAVRDAYCWIGPRFGQQKSESAREFLVEVEPYL